MPTEEYLDGDRITQAIFMATEAMGHPDPFLARELADGVLHFLRSETVDAPTNDTQLRDTAVAVVRSLGQPQLALILADQTWPDLPSAPIAAEDERIRDSESIARQKVFPGNLIAAHDAGLIRLGDLDKPFELVGGVMEKPAFATRPIDWVRRLLEARQRFGRFVVFDAADEFLQGCPTHEWIDSVSLGLQMTELTAICHLNTNTSSSPAGSLFSPRQPTLWPDDGPNPSLTLLRAADYLRPSNMRWVWHISPADLDQDREVTLSEVVRIGLRMDPLSFTLDRARRPVMLARGLPRGVPAVAQQVVMSLSVLRHYLSYEVSEDEFVEKCASLARLALGAGHAKRAFLRRQGRDELHAGFLVERSSLAVGIAGGDEVAEVDDKLRGRIINRLNAVWAADPLGMTATLAPLERELQLDELNLDSPESLPESLQLLCPAHTSIDQVMSAIRNIARSVETSSVRLCTVQN